MTTAWALKRWRTSDGGFDRTSPTPSADESSEMRHARASESSRTDTAFAGARRSGGAWPSVSFRLGVAQINQQPRLKHRRRHLGAGSLIGVKRLSQRGDEIPVNVLEINSEAGRGLGA